MEDIQLETRWKEFDRKIEEARILNLQAWAVNLQTFTELQTHKARTRLASLTRFKVRAVVLGIVWVAFLGLLVYGNQLKNLYFAISLGMIMLFNILGIIIYIRQVISIRKIDFSQSITDVQQRLSVLQTSTIRIVRIMFLQAPFYCTWFWSPRMIADGNWQFWCIAVPVTLCFTLLSAWLYKNISLKNIDRKWFRVLFNSIEWNALVRARNDLDEISAFKAAH